MEQDKVNDYYHKKIIKLIKHNKNKKILFWGASLFLKDFLKKYSFNEYKNIIGIIDKNTERNGKKYEDYIIYSPENIKDLNADIIILTIKNNSEICYKEVINYLTNKKINISVEQIFSNKTSERLNPEHYQTNVFDYILFLKHKFAYHIADKFINKDSSVLEIGSGEGYGANFLARTGANIIALDVDQETINIAKLKYPKKNLKFNIFDGFNINYPEKSFDVIISFQVIEHVEDVNKYLKNIQKLLKPNGIFLITTPNRTYRLTNEQKPWNKYHLREYNAEMLLSEASKIFNKTKIYSITAEKEILDIEFERVRPNRADYDKNFKNNILLPKNYKSKFGLKNFHLSNHNLDSGLDLLISNTDVDIFDSGNYWNKRYLDNKNSGYGSYGKLAEFKAQIINLFIKENMINSCIELGTGDGNQLLSLDIKNYIGFDVSDVIIKKLKKIFKKDKNKKFLHIKELDNFNNKADLSLSLDVIYHLIEDDVFESHMQNLFKISKKYVIIYSSNKNEPHCEHVKHRKFTEYIENNFKNWELIKYIPNKYPYNPKDLENTSFADFYIYKKIN